MVCFTSLALPEFILIELINARGKNVCAINTPTPTLSRHARPRLLSAQNVSKNQDDARRKLAALDSIFSVFSIKRSIFSPRSSTLSMLTDITCPKIKICQQHKQKQKQPRASLDGWMDGRGFQKQKQN
jgi:hypothetical protein